MIGILIPSRQRYSRLIKTISSAIHTAKNKMGFRFIVYVDKGDEQINEYKKLDETECVTWLYGSIEVLSDMWNTCYRYIPPADEKQGNILMHASDDIEFQSQGWDVIVEEYFKHNSVGLIYGPDGHTENLATHSFTSRYAADLVGYFVPPYFEADFNDVWLTEVYRRLGKLKFDKKLVIKHWHVNVDKTLDDDTYKIAVKRRERAGKVYEEKKHLIDDDVKKLTL